MTAVYILILDSKILILGHSPQIFHIIKWCALNTIRTLHTLLLHFCVLQNQFEFISIFLNKKAELLLTRISFPLIQKLPFS